MDVKLNDIFVVKSGCAKIGFKPTTNHIEFYQVVGFKGKRTFFVRPINSKTTMLDENSGYKIPILNDFINEDEPLRKNLAAYTKLPMITFSNATFGVKEKDATNKKFYFVK